MCCGQLTQLIKTFASEKEMVDCVLEKKLPVVDGIKARGNIEEAFKLNIDKIDPDRIKVREEIARKLDLDMVDFLSNGLYVGEKELNKFVINAAGTEILIGPALNISDSGRGTYLIEDTDDKRCVIDSEGNKIWEIDDTYQFEFDQNYFNGGVVPILVGNSFDKEALLRWDGKVILKQERLENFSFSYGDRIWAKKNNKYILYDFDENKIAEQELDHVDFDPTTDGKWFGFKDIDNRSYVYSIDTEGNIKELGIYIDDSSFFELISKTDTGRGYVDGKEIIFDINGEIYYDESENEPLVLDIRDGLFAKKREGGFVLVDEKSKPLNGEIYDEIISDSLKGLREDNYFIAKKGDEFFFLNHQGEKLKIIPETKLVNAWFFDNKGLAKVRDEKGEFIINKGGRDLFLGRRRYQSLIDVSEGIYQVSSISEPLKYVNRYGREIFTKTNHNNQPT